MQAEDNSLLFPRLFPRLSDSDTRLSWFYSSYWPDSNYPYLEHSHNYPRRGTPNYSIQDIGTLSGKGKDFWVHRSQNDMHGLSNIQIEHSPLWGESDGLSAARALYYAAVDEEYARILPPKQIQRFKSRERKLEKQRLAYVFVTPLAHELKDPVAMMRIYDGTNEAYIPGFGHSALEVPARIQFDGPGRLPLQRSHPGLKLPDGEERVEFGAMVKKKNVYALDPSGEVYSRLDLVSAQALSYLHETHGRFGRFKKNLYVYIEIMESNLPMYLDRAFVPVAGTESLPEKHVEKAKNNGFKPATYQVLEPISHEARFILKVRAQDLYDLTKARFGIPDFGPLSFEAGN